MYGLTSGCMSLETQRTEAERAHTHMLGCLHIHKHTCTFTAAGLEVSETGACAMMDVLYLLAPDSRAAVWTEGWGRPSVNAHFSPYFNCYVCACMFVCRLLHPGCCPVSGSDRGSSGGGLWAALSLPICPGCASAVPALAALTGGVATVDG